MDNTFIKLNRSIINFEWYLKPNTYRLFIHCLLKANWKDGKFEGKTIKRGSFVTSLDKLSLELGLTTQQIRTSISHLKSTNNITSKSHSKYRIITVLNYNDYQDNNKQDNSQVTSNQQASNKQVTTIEEKKELKNSNNKEKIYKKEIYGEFKNVSLSDEEYSKLQSSNLLYIIDKLSLYIESTGKKYKSHYATILSWSRKEPKQSIVQEFKQEEDNLNEEERLAMIEKIKNRGKE